MSGAQWTPERLPLIITNLMEIGDEYRMGMVDTRALGEAADALRDFASVMSVCEQSKYGLVVRDIQAEPGWEARCWSERDQETPTAWGYGDSPFTAILDLAKTLDAVSSDDA